MGPQWLWALLQSLEPATPFEVVRFLYTKAVPALSRTN